MTTGNPALAAILDRGDTEAEAEADAMLAAIVDFGVLVPVNEAGSVIFFKDHEGRAVLPAYASERVGPGRA